MGDRADLGVFVDGATLCAAAGGFILNGWSGSSMLSCPAGADHVKAKIIIDSDHVADLAILAIDHHRFEHLDFHHQIPHTKASG